MYEVYLERRAERDLKRLSEPDFGRVMQEIRELAGNPRPIGSRKITGSLSDWRIRVGTFRVIYEIDDGSRAVRVMRVRPRREAYR